MNADERRERTFVAAVELAIAVNNYLLPLWMIVFGGGLVRVSGSGSAGGSRKRRVTWT
jgi:hypothetical protein